MTCFVACIKSFRATPAYQLIVRALYKAQDVFAALVVPSVYDVRGVYCALSHL